MLDVWGLLATHCDAPISIYSQYRSTSECSSNIRVRNKPLPVSSALWLLRIRNMTNRSHQSVLGLCSNPSPREIRLAYLRASVKAHPGHDGSDAEMMAARQASHLSIY
jgi:hypothetical protein